MGGEAAVKLQVLPAAEIRVRQHCTWQTQAASVGIRRAERMEDSLEGASGDCNKKLFCQACLTYLAAGMGGHPGSKAAEQRMLHSQAWSVPPGFLLLLAPPVGCSPSSDSPPPPAQGCYHTSCLRHYKHSLPVSYSPDLSALSDFSHYCSCVHCCSISSPLLWHSFPLSSHHIVPCTRAMSP